MFKYLALTLAAVSAFQTIDITENGKKKKVYVVGPKWYSGVSNGKVEIKAGGRSYFANSDALGPNNFYTPNLRGGKFSFTTDLSQFRCGCNGALYLVSMPGREDNGTPRRGGGDYYCDANNVGGSWCPEFDIMEANQWAYQTTPHSCNAADWNGHYDYCNRSGSCW